MLVAELLDEATGITAPELEQRYQRFNDELFDGKLPMIPIRVAALKGVGGHVTAKVRTVANTRDMYGRPKKELVPGSVVMTISNLFQRNGEDLNGILVHEMIHVWFIAVTGQLDENHGGRFLAMRRELNTKVAFDIPLTDNTTGLALAKQSTKRVGAVLLVYTDRSSIAVFSEDYLQTHLAALKFRWAIMINSKSALRAVKFIITSGTVEKKYPVQRKKHVMDIIYYKVTDPALLAEINANAQVIDEIIRDSNPSAPSR